MVDAVLQLTQVELFLEQYESLIDPPLQIISFENLLQFLARGSRQRHGKIGQFSRFCKVGVAEENLQFFFEKRVELEKILNRRDDADRIGLELLRALLDHIVVVFHAGFENFVTAAHFDRLADGDAPFHIENDLRSPLFHRNDPQNAREHTHSIHVIKLGVIDVDVLFFREKKAHALVL